MMTMSMMFLMFWMVAVEAVKTTAAEVFYEDCCFAALIVAAYAALENEVPQRFFDNVARLGWSMELINQHVLGMKVSCDL